MVAVTEAAGIQPERHCRRPRRRARWASTAVAMARADGAGHGDRDRRGSGAADARPPIRRRRGSGPRGPAGRMASSPGSGTTAGRAARTSSSRRPARRPPWPTGLRLLRPGGRLVTAGLVVPGSIVTLRRQRDRAPLRHDPRRAQLRPPPPGGGPRLRPATSAAGFPLGELVDARFPLEAVDAALTAAAERRALRPAVAP